LSYAEFFTSTNPLVGPRDAKKRILTVFGVPYDGTTSYRPGTRFGPNALRDAFLNVEAYSKELRVDVENLPLRDLGNLSRVSEAEETIGRVSKVTKEFFDSGERFCMLGGEHSITFGSFRNAAKDTALVVFDAHFDLRNEWEGSRYSHASYLRRISEVRDVSCVAHIGGRAATEEEWQLSKELGLVVGSGEADSADSIRLFKRFVSRFRRVYVSVDLDGLDPAYAPGVGTPEPGGLTTLTALKYVYALKGSDLSAFDIVELCPAYDNGSTATLAARLMNELVAIASIQK
jgi:agmatinase